MVRKAGSRSSKKSALNLNLSVLNTHGKEVEKLNELLVERGAPTLDFDADIRSISEAAAGGFVRTAETKWKTRTY